MWECSYCRKKDSRKQRFCHHCGKRKTSPFSLFENGEHDGRDFVILISLTLIGTGVLIYLTRLAIAFDLFERIDTFLTP